MNHRRKINQDKVLNKSKLHVNLIFFNPKNSKVIYKKNLTFKFQYWIIRLSIMLSLIYLAL